MATVSARSAWWLAVRPATLTASAAPGKATDERPITAFISGYAFIRSWVTVNSRF